jgi:hypothetical protein
MLPTDDALPLDDPSHDAVRGELARLFVLHKRDLGLAGRDDIEIVQRVDDIAYYVLIRVGAAMIEGDSAFLDKFGWLIGAFERLESGLRAADCDA